MRIVFLSNHWYPSPRRAGFQHLAEACHTLGHEVTFATVGFSWVSYARRDFRTRFKGIWQARNRMQAIKPGLQSYVHFTPWHPHSAGFHFLDVLFASQMKKYTHFSLGLLKESILHANVIIYESNASLYLLDLCKQLAPRAQHIYRVSDDIRTLRSTPPDMLSCEQTIAPHFSCISVPCTALQDKFPPPARVHVLKHGISKEVFNEATTSPYPQETKNCIFTGVGFYDTNTVHHMAITCPQVHFHIIGIEPPTENIPSSLHYYGEMPFKQTIPFIQHADCGLYTLRGSSRPMQAYTDSLKVMQYRYCGLPIVAPTFLNLQREGVFYYQPENAESCAAAVQNALAHGKHPEYAQEVRSWQEVAQAILEEAATV